MKLLWLDLETTGLDPQQDCILEIALMEADFENPFEVGEGFQATLPLRVSHDMMLHEFHPIVLEMHTKNGLWDECRKSTRSLADVEDALLNRFGWSRGMKIEHELYVLAGSTVSFDHEFLKLDMREFARHLSHRHYDVSAIKLFCQSLGMPKLPKGEAHRAMADIRESIAHARECARWLCPEHLGDGPVPPKAG